MMGGLDDGPELPKSAVMAWKKPLVIKAFQEGLSARACARVFDVSHETAACWTAGHQRKKDVPDKQPPKIEGLREDDWRPIETAPKDGTRILMYQREAGGEYGKIEYEDYYFVGWFDKYWYCCEYSAFEREPTHWMPLPEQPAQLAAQEG